MNIGQVQVVRKAAFFVGVCVALSVFAFTSSASPPGSNTHEFIEWVGLVLIVVCIIGRTWTSLYISGRKNKELIEVGPYSVTRNPLYAFSILGATGAGAQHGTAVVALTIGLLAWMAFYVVTLREEALLSEIYGARFETYKAQTPRFIPNRKLWRGVSELTVTPPRVVRTFIDAIVLLLAVPIAEGLEYLQEINVLPVLIVLP
jgi:protein-S-isoprenylcysteine O-methyltransferase Ste14